MLELKNLTLNFGGVTALDDITLDVLEGEFLGVIGPNGAGKTTLLNGISRLFTSSSGDIRFHGESLLPLGSHQLISRGIARTFQNLALCQSLTVRSNVMLGGIWRNRNAAIAHWVGAPWARRAVADLEKRVEDAMNAVGLSALSEVGVAHLSHGMKRRTELARCLCAKPRLLLLDEPASGLTADESKDLVLLLKKLRDSHKLTLIVIEHHMDVVMSLSDRIAVLESGKLIAEGTPSFIANNERVVEAYLGNPI